MVVGALVIVLVVGVVALVVARSVSGGGAADQSQPGAVIVVPGYGGTASDVMPIVDELRREGRTAIAFQPTGGGTGDLRVQAKRLADLAQRTIDRTGIASVDVVGYSAGGVVAGLWVARDDGAAKARRIVTIGAPLAGTTLAALGASEAPDACPTACRQLAPGSTVLAELARAGVGAALPWLSLWTADDRTVTPPESARLPGAVNVRLQDLCPGAVVSHDALPGNPAVAGVVTAALGTGPLGAGVGCPT